MSASELAVEGRVSGVLAERLVALLGRATSLAFELERLEHSGVQTLTPFDEHYPKNWKQRLGPKAPPLLYAAGPVELLDTAGLGVVGSRDVSPSGAEIAIAAAKCASRHSIPVVSGGARGVDQLAMNSAFDSGGAVIGLLADSLSRRLTKSDVRAAIHSGQALMCTPYNPDAGFSAGNAMGRNKLIYAQSTFTLVVATDEGKGGTWSGATEALDHKFGRVAVWRGPGEGPGNETLERRGAVPISDLDDLGHLLDGAVPIRPPTRLRSFPELNRVCSSMWLLPTDRATSTRRAAPERIVGEEQETSDDASEPLSLIAGRTQGPSPSEGTRSPLQMMHLHSCQVRIPALTEACGVVPHQPGPPAVFPKQLGLQCRPSIQRLLGL